MPAVNFPSDKKGHHFQIIYSSNSVGSVPFSSWGSLSHTVPVSVSLTLNAVKWDTCGGIVTGYPETFPLVGDFKGFPVIFRSRVQRDTESIPITFEVT